MTRILAAVALFVAVAPLRAADFAVSPDNKMVFVSAKGGGIEAIDLAFGKIIWSNKTANKVAAASNKMAFGWMADEKKPNVFRVLALDAMIGRELGKSDPIEMPDWATTAKTHGRTFWVGARDDGDLAIVAWEAGAFYAGGAAPTPEILAAAKKDAAAVVWVKFDTGKVTPLKDKKKEDYFKAPKPGDNGGYELSVDEQLPDPKPGAEKVTKVTLTVKKDGRQLWSRELAGNPWNPPPP
jgi:hypothetical protein